MLGYCREGYAAWLAGDIRNEFAEGCECGRLEGEIYNARVRLGQRLGTDIEDRDILALVNAYEAMQRELCLKMYAYGRSVR